MKRGAGRVPWRSLATESANRRSRDLDRLGIHGVVALMQSEDLAMVRAVAKARPQISRAAALLSAAYAAGKTCVLFGAGTSGRLAVIEAAELPPTFGTDPRRVRAVIAGGPRAVFRAKEGAEDREDEGARGAARLRHGDLAIGVSASSVTPFVRGALARARAQSAGTVLLTASGSRGLASVADVVIVLDVGPEVLAGSTRLKAGSATKLALNQITTAAFASAGRVYGPWMVDLRAGSAKLKDRSVRIVAAACEVSPRRAKSLLERAEGEVKTAIVVGRRKLSVSSARHRLAAAQGDLRRALEAAAE
ncbi:MAG: N-acetylmuramic acid 6-phosphate etherase [Acidobacteriota bacterium]|nr:N-acetylmuramic acid 6-phosphate etherase [Acidobacteriota bacterium]